MVMYEAKIGVLQSCPINLEHADCFEVIKEYLHCTDAGYEFYICESVVNCATETVDVTIFDAFRVEEGD